MQALAKVLVVDDDAVVGQSFDRVLSKKGYSVSTAMNGQEALSQFAGGKHDVVFTDIKMPGMNGIEVAQRIKAKSPWTPVVVVTGYGTPDNEAAAAAVGVADFLRKPLLPSAIEEVMERITKKPIIEEKVSEIAEEAREITEDASKSMGVGRTLKNIGLFFAAPFIGLAYFIAFPFIGLGMLVWYGIQALTGRSGSER
ncbi:MAG: response regulator [Gammaproteobacteria bacterium]|nr:response regulator [Gammaproteobacteria bacterium]MDH3464738.1 response regulator [Gammaproteobacteria bacterium]